MGKGSSAPQAPDPIQTANAQTASNQQTANYQAGLNAVDQITPNGSLTYSQSTWADGTPKYTATQTLSQAGQQLQNTNASTSQNLANLANQQSGKLSGLLNQEFSLNGLPAAGTVPQYQNYAQGPALNTTGGSTAGIKTGYDAGGTVNGTIANAGGITNQIASGGALTDNIRNAGAIQNTVANSGNVTNQIANAGNIQSSLGSNDFSGDRQRVEDALFTRLNPQTDRDRQNLETSLVNRGIRPGSSAYQQEMNTFNQGLNDQRTSILLNAGQEQNRLQQLALNSGNFANSAQAQQYGQNANNAAFANSAQSQLYGQNANNLSLANAAQNQQYGQNASDAAFTNATQNQRYGQNANNAQFANSAQAQQFGQNAAMTQSEMAAQAQRNSQNANAATFGNNAQQQLYAQQMGNASFSNQGLQQQFANNQATTGLNNANQDNRFNAQNTARQQALQEQLTARNVPLNELLAVAGQGQVQQPTFVNNSQTQVGGTDVAGLIQSGYQNQMGAYQQQQQGNNQMLGGLFSAGASLLPLLSDRRAKTDIQRIGATDAGTPIYRFRYKHGGPVQIGYMAQDLLETQPDAVTMGPDGFYRVAYDKVA